MWSKIDRKVELAVLDNFAAIRYLIKQLKPSFINS